MENSKKIKQLREWLRSGSINIFGLPFAGKDTQGQRLAKMFEAPLLGGGDILRRAHMPEHIKNLHSTGKLFPTDIYMELVLPYLSQKDFEGKALLLSSVGRWHGEEAGVLDATAAAGHPIKAVIYLNISEDTVWKRWEAADLDKERGARADDSYETLQIRLEEFRNKTLPVIDFYRSQNLLIEIDGEQATDKLTSDLISSLYSYASLD